MNLKARVNGGLSYIDEFGQKISSEGNYRIEVRAEPGECQVQKSNITRIAEIKIETILPEIETININTGTNETGANSGDGWTFSEGVLTITGNGNFKIEGTGEAATNHVKVNSGTNVFIILSNVNINVQGSYNTCAFDMTGAKVNMYLDSNNSLVSGQGRAGLEVPDGAELEISSLEGDGNSYSKHIKISMLRVLRYKPLAYYTPLSSPESLIFAHYS